MSRYFLDTHIVGWLLSNSPKLDEELRYDIEYPSGNQYVTSEFVLLELLHLKLRTHYKHSPRVESQSLNSGHLSCEYHFLQGLSRNIYYQASVTATGTKNGLNKDMHSNNLFRKRTYLSSYIPLLNV